MGELVQVQGPMSVTFAAVLTLAWVVVFAAVSFYALHSFASGRPRPMILVVWGALMIGLVILGVMQWLSL